MDKLLIKPEIIKQAEKRAAVVFSYHINPEEGCRNSGIIINPNSILTASHCIVGKTTIRYKKKFYPVKEVGVGLCAAQITLLTTEKPVFDGITKIKITRELKIGEPVFYVSLTHGNIFGAFHYGYLSASAQHQDDITYYYIDGPFCHGMSGSGVYNVQGELIGITILTMSTENMMLTTGLVVPVNYFEPLIYFGRDDLVIKPKKDSPTETEEK